MDSKTSVTKNLIQLNLIIRLLVTKGTETPEGEQRGKKKEKEETNGSENQSQFRSITNIMSSFAFICSVINCLIFLAGSVVSEFITFAGS